MTKQIGPSTIDQDIVSTLETFGEEFWDIFGLHRSWERTGAIILENG